jgi:hypothetical protein
MEAKSASIFVGWVCYLMPEISPGTFQSPLENHDFKTFMDRGGKEDPMTRGIRAPLSPHEEVTLRRIALGITQAPHLSKSDIRRLMALSLIEENGGGLGLTPMGSERYLSLAKSAAVDPSHSPDEFVSKLAEIMTKARR